jgi:lipopolysaccharide assembly outer membrane protein LptD (OstA)
MFNRFVIPYICLLLFGFNSSLSGQQVRTIQIVNANSLTSVPGRTDVQRLIGNVILSDSSVTMYCDSAYNYSSNKMDAFSNIRIVQNSGSLRITSEILNYDGNTKMAELHRNVVLNDDDMTLRTQNIYYDLRTGIASYTDSAYIVNKGTVITSKKGQYYKNEKRLRFQQRVRITDPKYRIKSDTVDYITVTKVAYFYGPTNILTEKDSIYCERGWYNTVDESSNLYRNPFIITEGRKIKGDTLIYMKATGYGRAIGNVEMIDTVQNAIVRGQRAIYTPDKERAVVTDSALLIQISEGDSLFVHADTIRSDPDSTGKYRFLKAYYKVRMFRHDLQGKCDSLCYSSVDSTLQFHGSPVLWSDSTQLTAEFIQMYMANKKIDRMELRSSAFMIMQDDSTKYSQIKGKNMMGYFQDGKIQKVVVKGNGQTLYYPKDQGEYIGMNKTTSSDVIIYMKDNKPKDIVLLVKPEGTLYPMDQIAKEDMFLKDFKWLDNIKPKRKEDIFVWK